MAISHIGRLLQERAEQERMAIATNLLEGSAKTLEDLYYYIGRAEGIKWIISQIEEIEGDR